MPRIANIVTSQKTFVFLICSLLLAIPLQYGYSTGILIALVVVSFLSLKNHKSQWNPAYLIPFGLYGLMVLSLAWSINIDESIRGLERQLGLLVIPLAFICMPSITQNSNKAIFYYFSLGMAGYALFFMVVAAVNFVETNDSSVFFYHALVSILDLNAIYVSVLCSLCIIFLLFKVKKTLLSVLALLILSVFLFLLASKTVVVATFLVSVFGLFKTFNRKTVTGSVLVLIVVLIALVLFPNPVKKRFTREIKASNIEEVFSKEKFNKVYDWTGTTIRLFQGRIFYEMLDRDDVFLTGYGINTSQSKIIEKQKEYNLWQGYYTYNFHNQYLQAFAELGVFGLLFVGLLLIVLFKQYLSNNDILFIALFFIMLAVFITESYLWRQRGLYHFILLYCLLFKTEEEKSFIN